MTEMDPTKKDINIKKRPARKWMKALGPGLLFASTAIGTSHLVLSTRAGAHHGWIFFWIIGLTLLLKYPFYEFGPRYASATGFSLLKAYKNQGKWAVGLFFSIIAINMFAVVGGVGAVCGGILSTMMGFGQLSMVELVAVLFGFTALALILGKYTVLDYFIKILSLVLFVSVAAAFFSVAFSGGVREVVDTGHNPIFEGAGLVLLISLIGWMPNGMEASTMNSIWLVEKQRIEKSRLTIKDALFDFNLGYGFTTITALMFMAIGAFVVYGSGRLLEGNSTQFSNQLLAIFIETLGPWSKPLFVTAAFGAIYGTLITAWDAFARCFNGCLRIFSFKTIENNQEQEKFLTRRYPWIVVVIGGGGFLLFSQFTGRMIQLLELVTIIAFMTSPIISYLNLRAIQGSEVAESYRPPRWMIRLAYLGLLSMIGFGLFYAYYLIFW